MAIFFYGNCLFYIKNVKNCMKNTKYLVQAVKNIVVKKILLINKNILTLQYIKCIIYNVLLSRCIFNGGYLSFCHLYGRNTYLKASIGRKIY